MKSKITLLFLAIMVMISCSKNNVDESIEESYNIIGVPGQIDDGILGEDQNLYEDDLLAGQTIDAGTLTVDLVDGEVVVTYTTDSDWVIVVTHLYVGDLADLPTNGAGNPQIGHFPYGETLPAGTTEATYTTITLEEGECVYVAAHAEVVNTVTGQTETAWAAGVPIGGNSWAMMFEICN
ncbi:MAG: hypothetical protein R2793_05625 [Flavobacteriaceae bacterium]